MPRIRTIKPETPQSETMGRLSREARLCYLLLWTQADDEGRLRGNSRGLASLLFPYDDDARDLIPTWLDELEAEGCVRRYEAGGNQYLDMPKWLIHQKVDKPTKSRLPSFDEGSPLSREPSRGLVDGPRTLDLGPRTMDHGPEERAGPEIATPSASPPPVIEIVTIAVQVWNEMASANGLAVVQKLSAPRKKLLAARLADCGGLAGWQAALARIAGNPFLRGDNDRGWRADFDFVCKAKSFTKIMEGGYDGKPTGSKRGTNTEAGDRAAIANALAPELGTGQGDSALAEQSAGAG